MLLDHVVVLVDDLDMARQDYTDLGFAVVQGGRHADGITQNALVAFQDGSYIELINFLQPPPSNHFFARGARSVEGIIAFALLPDSIEADIARARRHGLTMHGPVRGGRLRPDDLEISWQTGWADNPELPFFCADITPRNLRVPHGPARQHPNGVTGIANVAVLVEDVAASRERYRALLPEDTEIGTEEGQTQAVARFKLGPTTLTLRSPQGSAENAWFEQHGPGAYALTLLARHDSLPGAAHTHGVPLSLQGPQ